MRHRINRLDSRLNSLLARPGFAGHRGRVAMRGRHASELAAELRHAMIAAVRRRARRHEIVRRALVQFDPRHRLGVIRTGLVAREGALTRTMARRLHAMDSRFRALAARLDGLSPLAVLARGYAVCWDADRTRILRDASQMAPGDRVIVTLEHGELGCSVAEVSGATRNRPDRLDRPDLDRAGPPDR
jgi:exodeoxyribonuclease VII large subunit